MADNVQFPVTLKDGTKYIVEVPPVDMSLLYTTEDTALWNKSNDYYIRNNLSKTSTMKSGVSIPPWHRDFIIKTEDGTPVALLGGRGGRQKIRGMFFPSRDSNTTEDFTPTGYSIIGRDGNPTMPTSLGKIEGKSLTPIDIFPSIKVDKNGTPEQGPALLEAMEKLHSHMPAAPKAAKEKAIEPAKSPLGYNSQSVSPDDPILPPTSLPQGNVAMARGKSNSPGVV